LGVPGRPAGGIDVLACIPGFKTSLTRAEIDHCLASCRYAHFLAGESFAPLDAVLFEYRRKVGATDLPALAIASLLAKKRALGVNHVVLDVRVAPFTNFGQTWDEARQNAVRFIRVAKMLHIQASCFLTDATAPYQGFLGRGESLVALHRIFSGDLTEDLAAHLGLCSKMASACFVNRHARDMTDLKGVFTAHLEQQGGSWDSFARKVNEVESQTSRIMTAESDGYVCLNLAGVRELLVLRQEEAKSTSNQFPDPCGLTLSVPWGSAVQKGDVVAKVRSSGNLVHLLEQLRLHTFQSVHPPVRHASETVASNG
jgi:thymidine phosphorylase